MLFSPGGDDVGNPSRYSTFLAAVDVKFRELEHGLSQIDAGKNGNLLFAVLV